MHSQPPVYLPLIFATNICSSYLQFLIPSFRLEEMGRPPPGPSGNAAIPKIRLVIFTPCSSCYPCRRTSPEGCEFFPIIQYTQYTQYNLGLFCI
ncbi:hypothetical protein MSMTP_2316 [Methanosarcina sp. MTP4]|nr:hypothetical protein MSMTP_2316 [Methanosarcina sp. MTP4]